MKTIIHSLHAFILMLLMSSPVCGSADMFNSNNKDPSSSKHADDSLAEVTKKVSHISLEDSAPPSWGHTMTNLYFNATFKPDIEMAKFPAFSVAILLEQLQEEDDHTKIIGKRYRYRTGSNEKSPDYYSGWLHFTHLDYGEAEHTYLGPQKGFDSSPTLISRSSEIKPHAFIKELAELGVIPTVFFKGTPYKNPHSKTCIEYTLFSRSGNRYITVKAFRDLNEIVD